jgi:hypothetical protein
MTSRVAFAVALAILFLATAVFRFMTLATGFTNDHFLHLAGAQQMLFGEWPTKDFLDPGLPLMYAASALAQLLMGEHLLAEGILVTLAFALAAVMTAAAVRELTGSRVLALIAAVLEIAIVPRAYGYPKIFFYATAFFLLQRYVTRPTTGRLLALAMATAVAFLFRHDHGVYLGTGGVLAAWLVHGSAPLTERARRAATFAGMTALLVAPYLLYVQIYGGLWSYAEVGLAFRAAELARQSFAWPTLFGERPHEAALFYGYWALPIAAAVLVLALRRRDDGGQMVARVVPICAVALLVNWTFLRDPLTGRLQDAVVPAVTLGAWLMSRAWRAQRPWVWRPLSALLIVLFANSLVEVGATLDHASRAGLGVSWRRWPEFIRVTASRLRAPHAEKVMPSRPAAALQPFYLYVARCTTRRHRLLVAGNIPEILFFTQRAFAAGRPAFVQNYYDSEAYQREALTIMSREAVPFVVIPGRSYAADFGTTFPLVATHVREHYVPLATFGDADTGAQVMVDRALSTGAPDASTGWPCPSSAGD